MPSANTDIAQLKEAIRKYSYRENHAEPFTLASGKKSPYYFDLKQTLLQPEYLALVGRIIAAKIREQYAAQVVAAGLTMGADPLIYAAAIADHNIIPAIVRKEAKDHGTGKRVEILKSITNDTPCVMVDDVITTAGSTLKAHAVMKDAGFSIQHAYCVLDREAGGVSALEANGVKLVAIFTAAEFKEK